MEINQIKFKKGSKFRDFNLIQNLQLLCKTAEDK